MGQISSPDANGKKLRWLKKTNAPLGNFSNLKQIILVKKQDNLLSKLLIPPLQGTSLRSRVSKKSEKKIAGSSSQRFKVLVKVKKVANPASVNKSMANNPLFFAMGHCCSDEFFFNGLGQIQSFYFFAAGFGQGVMEHDGTKGAGSNDGVGAGFFRLGDAAVADPFPGLFFLPHAAAAAAAKTGLFAGRHFQGSMPIQGFQELPRLFVNVVVTAEITGIVVGHFCIAGSLNFQFILGQEL